MSNFISLLPPMKFGQELTAAMEVLPKYDRKICLADASIRLRALSDIYSIYVPSQMSSEIYSKLYLSLLHSMQKKEEKIAVRQRYENNSVRPLSDSGILGGADSYTIVGISGIGKSCTINRAISLITENRVYECTRPYCKIIPCLIVQCPFDSSVKGLLLEILRKIDEKLSTEYYSNAIRSRSFTTDILIGTVSTLALNHIGLLIIDEIQNVVNSKNGKNLIGMLTQLINNSGISICMVGTNESTVFFEQAMQLARRSLGLQYNRLDYDQYFHDFCSVLFRYQYVKKKTELTSAILRWLYEHSAGVISVVVSLIHDAQEIAILGGIEEISLETLNEAYRRRVTLLHGYIEPAIKQSTQCSSVKREVSTVPVQGRKKEIKSNFSIRELVDDARENKCDIVSVLKEYIAVAEVRV